MANQTLASLTAATPASGGLFYGTQDGADRKFTLSAAGAAMMEATDALKLDELAAPTDTTSLNATTSAHGLLPKLGGGTSNFLRADGAWSAPDTGGVKALIVSGNTALTAGQCKNGVVYVTASCSILLPPIEDGMSVTLIAMGPVSISLDSSPGESISLESGASVGNGNPSASPGQIGDKAVITYYDTSNWYASTNGWGTGA